MAYSWFGGIEAPLLMFGSTNLSALAGAFIALHLRRQFGTAAAHLVPGFATPHLVVGLAAGMLLWLVFPASLVLAGYWEPKALAMHAIAGLLMALVVWSPRAIILLAGLPVALGLLMDWSRQPDAWLAGIVAHHQLSLTTCAVAVALAAQAAAAWSLLRLDDQSAVGRRPGSR